MEANSASKCVTMWLIEYKVFVYLLFIGEFIHLRIWFNWILFSFSYAILVQCLLMNKDTFILGPSNQSLRLARQDKGGFSQIWHGLACSGSVKRRPGMHKVDHNYKAHLLGLQYPRDILSTCTFHHQQYFIIFSFLVQEMQKHNIRKLWCRKIMVFQ